MKVKQSQAAGLSLTALRGLYAYLFCMMASNVLLDMPIFGGALFICGQVATIYLTTYTGENRFFLPAAARRWQTALLVLLLMLSVFIVVLYPIALDNPMLWLMFAIVLLVMLRDALCTRLLARNQMGEMQEKPLYLWVGGVQLVSLLIMNLSLLYNVGGMAAWQMLAGYVLSSGMECYSMFKERAALRPQAPVDGERVSAAGEKVRSAHAFKRYETLSALILAALVMTLIVMHTFLAVTAETLVISMVLAVAVMMISREAAELTLRWREKRHQPDPTNMMLVGLILWLVALAMFSDMLRDRVTTLPSVYVYLGLCSMGAALSLTSLERMEPAIAQVAQFAARDDAREVPRLRGAVRQLAVLLGEMLALVALTVLCFVNGKDLPRDMAQIAARFQPVMVVPALLTVLAAVISVLRFPLTSRWVDKLSRFLRLREDGGDNPALEKQLESVVVKRHKRPLGTRILIAVLRPFFKHELKGTENIRPDVNNPIVFLCNHGEIYGPVVCMLYIPVAIRPWVMSELNIDKAEVAAYVHKHTISKITWLGPLRWPIAKMIGPVSVWCMQQLESIPVFRNKPRELMNTFRTSVEAMQAGDNLLIFPENPDADRDNPGYEHEKGGMGELFRGFAMLAQVYYNRTGKRCRFLPMYAHKGMRTISFGTEIVYDPDADPMKERDRIVDGAYEQMLAMAAREDALYQERSAKGDKTESA